MPPPAPNTSYKTFIIQDQRFSVGEHVLVSGGSGRTDYVAALEGIYTDDKGEVHVKVHWFYRPEELPGGRQPWHGSDEVIDSDHTDSCHVGCVNGKCHVYSLEEYENLDQSEQPSKKKKGDKEKEKEEKESAADAKDIPIFFTRSFFLKSKKKLREPLPVICVCKRPVNPDKLQICCDKCSKWYHGECMNVKESQKAKLKQQWLCPTCKS